MRQPFKAATALLLLLSNASYAMTYNYTKSEFKMSHESYVNSSQGYFGKEDTSSQVSTAGVTIDSLSNKGKHSSHIDVHAFYSFAEDKPFINPTELYYERKGKTATVTYGRKIQELSYADDFWELGLWQPRFTWDKLKPEQNGLTGLFFEGQNKGGSNWLGFVTGINVPEQGPSYYIENGIVTSKNPWFKRPPKTANIAGVDTDVTYTIDKPQTEDIIFKPGLGFRFENSLATTETVGFSYAYKPINQFLTSYDYRLRIADASQTAPIRVIPQFPYHHMVSGDWRRQDDKINTALSLTFESPVRLPDNEQLISQQIDDQLMASAIVSYDVAGEGPSAFKMYGGILKSWGAIADDSGDTFSGSTQFELRQRWYEAYRVGMTYPVWTKWKRLYNTMELTYDRAQNGGLFMTQLEYNVFDSWILTGALDVMAVFDSKETRYDNSLIRNFRANDRVSMGISYVY